MEMDVNSLAMLANNGDEKAFSVLLQKMEGAIGKVISRFAVGEGAVYRDDYRSEAMLGLYKCLGSYEKEMGAFISYATTAMSAQILDFIRNRQNTIKIGTDMLSKVQKVRNALEEIREKGLDENIETICRLSGIDSPKTVSSALAAMKVERCDNLDKSVGDDEDSSLIDFIASEEDVEETLMEREEERALRMAVASLPERDRYIALHAFGLFGCREMQNKDIAKKLGCTPNTVVNRKKAIEGSIRESMIKWAA